MQTTDSQLLLLKGLTMRSHNKRLGIFATIAITLTATSVGFAQQATDAETTPLTVSAQATINIDSPDRQTQLKQEIATLKRVIVEKQLNLAEIQVKQLHFMVVFSELTQKEESELRTVELETAAQTQQALALKVATQEAVLAQNLVALDSLQGDLHVTYEGFLEANAPDAPTEPWKIGVTIKPVDNGKIGGVEIGKVLPGSPAEKTGLRAGDRIVKCNNIKLGTPNDLKNLMQIVRDQEVTLTIAREDNGALIEFKITPKQKSRVLVHKLIASRVIIVDDTDTIELLEPLQVQASFEIVSQTDRMQRLEDRLERIEKMLTKLVGSKTSKTE